MYKILGSSVLPFFYNPFFFPPFITADACDQFTNILLIVSSKDT